MVQNVKYLILHATKFLNHAILVFYPQDQKGKENIFWLEFTRHLEKVLPDLVASFVKFEKFEVLNVVEKEIKYEKRKIAHKRSAQFLVQLFETYSAYRLRKTN